VGLIASAVLLSLVTAQESTIAPYIPATLVDQGDFSLSVGALGGAETTYVATYDDPTISGWTAVADADGIQATQGNFVVSCLVAGGAQCAEVDDTVGVSTLIDEPADAVTTIVAPISTAPIVVIPSTTSITSTSSTSSSSSSIITSPPASASASATSSSSSSTPSFFSSQTLSRNVFVSGSSQNAPNYALWTIGLAIVGTLCHQLS